VKADKTADGIGLVDAVQRKFVKKIPAGSDPEQFVLNADGSRIYIANEDVGAATILDAASGKVITFVPSAANRGVGVSPDGKFFYVTCETAGDVFAIDAQTYKVIATSRSTRGRAVCHFAGRLTGVHTLGVRGELNVIDTASQKLLQVITLPKGCRPMTVRYPGRQQVYASTGRAGSVCVVDAKTYQVLDTIKVGKRPWALLFRRMENTCFRPTGLRMMFRWWI